MGCNECQQNLFWRKLGRCAFCRWSSLLLLVLCLLLGFAARHYYGERHVYSWMAAICALLFALLSAAHWLRYLYLRLANKR